MVDLRGGYILQISKRWIDVGGQNEKV